MTWAVHPPVAVCLWGEKREKVDSQWKGKKGVMGLRMGMWRQGREVTEKKTSEGEKKGKHTAR